MSPVGRAIEFRTRISKHRLPVPSDPSPNASSVWRDQFAVALEENPSARRHHGGARLLAGQAGLPSRNCAMPVPDPAADVGRCAIAQAMVVDQAAPPAVRLKT